MKKIIIIILLLTIISIGVFYLFNKDSSIIKTGNIEQSLNQKWESKIDDQASIVVTVTPLDISPESKEWQFDIIMSTHIVDLDQDLVNTSILVDDEGKEYKAKKWDGPVGGHHREGVLIFDAPESSPKSFEIKISGIGDSLERSFKWNLN